MLKHDPDRAKDWLGVPPTLRQRIIAKLRKAHRPKPAYPASTPRLIRQKSRSMGGFGPRLVAEKRMVIPLAILMLAAFVAGSYFLFFKEGSNSPKHYQRPNAPPDPEETRQWPHGEAGRFVMKYPPAWRQKTERLSPGIELAISNENKSSPLEGSPKHVYVIAGAYGGTRLDSCFAPNLNRQDVVTATDSQIDGVPAKKYIVDMAYGVAPAYATIITTYDQNYCYFIEFLSLNPETRDANIRQAELTAATFRFKY